MRNLILATILLPSSAALAGGYIIPQENARDLALSSATTAAQTGPEAVFLDPAALAGPEGLALSVSDELLVNRTTWSDPSLGTASLVPQHNTPPSAAASFGMRVNRDLAWGVGVGLDVPAGGALVWPNGWQGQEYIESVDQKVYRVAAGAGFQVRYLKVGATFIHYQATEELHQAINFLDHDAEAQLGMSGEANGFGLGAELRIPRLPLAIGVNYTHSATLGLTGSVHFTGVPPSFTTLLHDQDVTEDLRIPNTLAVGAAYKIRPNLAVMAAYTWENWSLYQEDKFAGADGFSVTVPRNYEDAHVYRLGAEWRLGAARWLTVRGGALRSISPQPTSTVSPSLTDGDSWAVSLGAGVNVLRSLRVDAGYQQAWFDDVTSTGTETFPGTYRTHVDLFSLGVSWRPDLGLGRTPPRPD